MVKKHRRPLMPVHAAVWPARLPERITAPATSLWMNLAISAMRYPDKAALVFMGRVWTYQELMASAERLAGQLRGLGVQTGDRVVLDMQNCPQLVIAHFAILRIDAVVVPVNPMNRAEELKHYITDPDTKVAVTTVDLATELAQASAALPSEQRLKHLVVTQFTDVFDPEALASLVAAGAGFARVGRWPGACLGRSDGRSWRGPAAAAGQDG
jgi:fatty-acyl-CoA synthase